MKFSKLMAALEDFEETPIPESVAAVAEGDTVDPQPIGGADAPVNEPATIPDAGEVPLAVPEVSPLPTIDEPVVAETPVVVPAAVEGEGEVIAQELPVEAQGELIIDSPMDHDNTMAMMDGALVQETALANDLGEIVETHAALEAYCNLLKQAGRDGITRQAAGFLRVGLEQFHNDGHIDFSKQIASLEDMGDGPKQHLLPGKVDEKGLGAKLKEAAGKIWEWLKKTWGKAKEFVNNLRNGVVGLERKLKKASEVAGKTKGSAGEFTVPHPGRIAIGNKVEINVPDELKAVTAMACKVYPERMTQFYNGIASALSNYNPASSDGADVMAALEKAKDVLADVKASEAVLPGNVKIDVSESGVSYGITEAESADVGETKAQARAGSVIQAQLKDMFTICENLKAYVQKHEQMSKAAESVGQGLEKLKKAASGEGMEDGAASKAGEIETAVGKLLHQANPRGNEIVRYLARTTSAYADVIFKELKVEGSGEASASKEVATA
uniref:Internal head protein n=1 Tax=Pseudomonas phage RVTF4 TaxID=3236931 RepID=A0AB39CCM7_9VIRU